MKLFYNTLAVNKLEVFKIYKKHNSKHVNLADGS